MFELLMGTGDCTNLTLTLKSSYNCIIEKLKSRWVTFKRMIFYVCSDSGKQYFLGQTTTLLSLDV